eukprot:1965230-Pyramimonas_sp.AAC.1
MSCWLIRGNWPSEAAQRRRLNSRTSWAFSGSISKALGVLSSWSLHPWWTIFARRACTSKGSSPIPHLFTGWTTLLQERTRSKYPRFL